MLGVLTLSPTSEETSFLVMWKGRCNLMTQSLCSRIISLKILVIVTSYENSFKVWVTLKRVFASNSKSQLLSLQKHLQQVCKGNKLVSEYVAKVFEIINYLAIAREKTNEFDKVLYTLSRLGEKFESFVHSVTAREGDISLSSSKSCWEIWKSTNRGWLLTHR